MVLWSQGVQPSAARPPALFVRWLRLLDRAPDLSVVLWHLPELLARADCRIQLN